LSFVFQGNSVNGIGNFAEQDGFSRDYFRIDASARQMLPLAGLQLFLDVNNINARKNQAASGLYRGIHERTELWIDGKSRTPVHDVDNSVRRDCPCEKNLLKMRTKH